MMWELHLTFHCNTHILFHANSHHSKCQALMATKSSQSVTRNTGQHWQKLVQKQQWDVVWPWAQQVSQWVQEDESTDNGTAKNRTTIYILFSRSTQTNSLKFMQVFCFCLTPWILLVLFTSMVERSQAPSQHTVQVSKSAGSGSRISIILSSINEFLYFSNSNAMHKRSIVFKTYCHPINTYNQWSVINGQLNYCKHAKFDGAQVKLKSWLTFIFLTSEFVYQAKSVSF